MRAHSTPGRTQAFALGFLLVLGWALHDVAVFAQGGRPALLTRLLLPSLAFALAGGGLALFLARSRASLVAFGALCAVLSVLPLVRPFELARAVLWLPRAALLLVLAAVALALLRRRAPRPTLATAALAGGVLACLVKTVFRHGWLPASTPLAAGLLLALGTAWSPRPWLRRGGATLGLLVPVVWIGLRVQPDLRPSRPDLPPPGVEAPADAPSLLLVVLDTVRADHLGSYGYRRETTPFLDARTARDFTRFTSARSTSSWTLPSHASLFTGLMPADHGSSHTGLGAQPMRAEVTTLAERLRAAGYRTAGIPANQVYPRPFFGLDRGFEHFDDRRGGNVGSYVALAQMTGRMADAGHLVYRDARTITDLAIDWLDGQRSEPTFLFLNYMEAHKPYLPPDRYRDAFGGGGPSDPLHPGLRHQTLLYDREILYLDAELERLMRYLEQTGRYDRTAIVITSDHGEGLGDHGLVFHGRYLYEELILVPLLVKPRGARARALDETPLSGAEVHGLMLRLVGQDAFGATGADDVASEYYSDPEDPSLALPQKLSGLDLEQDFVTWLEGELKFIVGSKGTVVAYDLSVDPGERDPLDLAPERAAAALEHARRWWREHPTQPPYQGELGKTELEDLRALGY